MNTSAELFALPIENPKHLHFRDDAWLGGAVWVARYYLGKFLKSNEFLHGNDKFESHIKGCLKSNLPGITWLAKSNYLHDFMMIWLKHKYRLTDEHRRFPIPKETKEERAIVRIMESPEIGDDEIRLEFRCTEKTMKRWSKYNLFRIEQNRLSENRTKK